MRHELRTEIESPHRRRSCGASSPTFRRTGWNPFITTAMGTLARGGR